MQCMTLYWSYQLLLLLNHSMRWYWHCFALGWNVWNGCELDTHDKLCVHILVSPSPLFFSCSSPAFLSQRNNFSPTPSLLQFINAILNIYSSLFTMHSSLFSGHCISTEKRRKATCPHLATPHTPAQCLNTPRKSTLRLLVSILHCRHSYRAFLSYFVLSYFSAF